VRRCCRNHLRDSVVVQFEFPSETGVMKMLQKALVCVACGAKTA
jgi:hypothetical protein